MTGGSFQPFLPTVPTSAPCSKEEKKHSLLVDRGEWHSILEPDCILSFQSLSSKFHVQFVQLFGVYVGVIFERLVDGHFFSESENITGLLQIWASLEMSHVID